MAVLGETQDPDPHVLSVGPHPPGDEERTRGQQDSEVPRKPPSLPPLEGAGERLQRLLEEGVPGPGQHELIREAQRRGARQNQVGVQEIVQRTDTLHVQVRIEPSMLVQDDIPGRIHPLDLIRIALEERDELGCPLPDQPLQVFVGPEAVLPLRMRIAPALLSRLPLRRDRLCLPRLMDDTGNHGGRRR